MSDSYIENYCATDVGRYYTSAVELNDSIYVFGGFDITNNTLTNLIEKHDLKKPYTKPRAINIPIDILPPLYGIGLSK